MNKKEYALESMNESVLIIKRDGTISYANSQAKQIFELSDDKEPIFREVLSGSNKQNDELLDFVIDIIISGIGSDRKLISYTDSNNYQYKLFTSCTKMPDNEFVFTFTNQTELEKETQKRKDSTMVLTIFFMIACLWTIGVSVWMRTGEIFPVGYLTIVMEVLGIISALLIVKTTDFRFKDMGLSFDNIKQTIKRTLIRLVCMLAVFAIFKIVLLIVYPSYFKDDYPFWDWKVADYRLIKYLVTAFVQEFLARGAVQASLARVLDGKYAKTIAIFVTSVYFMSLHFQYGLPMMIGSGILSVILGFMYKKDDNIYGVTLVHYCFGKFADFLHLI